MLEDSPFVSVEDLGDGAPGTSWRILVRITNGQYRDWLNSHWYTKRSGSHTFVKGAYPACAKPVMGGGEYYVLQCGGSVL